MHISSLFLYTSLLFSVCAIQIPEYSSPIKQDTHTKEYYSHTDHHCIAYHYAVKYDGRGNIYIAGTEKDLSVHTHKFRCGNVPQGWKKVVAFNNRDVRYIIIKTFGYLNGIKCGGYITMDASVPEIHIFEKCHWGNDFDDKNTVHIPMIKMKVIAAKYKTNKIQHLRLRIHDLSNSTKVYSKKVDMSSSSKASSSSKSNLYIRKPYYHNSTRDIPEKYVSSTNVIKHSIPTTSTPVTGNVISKTPSITST
jgi:hypothetical protein